MPDASGHSNRATREPSAGRRTLQTLQVLVLSLATTAALMGAVASLMFALLGTGEHH